MKPEAPSIWIDPKNQSFSQQKKKKSFITSTGNLNILSFKVSIGFGLEVFKYSLKNILQTGQFKVAA